MASRLIVILWRDIPTQVLVKNGRNGHRVGLSERFQQAIDRAAMQTGMAGTDEYLGEWRQEARSFDGEAEAAADALAESLEDSHPDQLLNRYVENGGWSPTGQPA